MHRLFNDAVDTAEVTKRRMRLEDEDQSWVGKGLEGGVFPGIHL
jgi:hypothetical protein